jgi:hypothetical protein
VVPAVRVVVLVAVDPVVPDAMASTVHPVVGLMAGAALLPATTFDEGRPWVAHQEIFVTAPGQDGIAHAVA